METSINTTETTSQCMEQAIEKLNEIKPSQVEFPANIRIPAQGLPHWNWLEANSATQRVVWADRDSQSVSVGLGTAASIQSDGDAAQCLAKCREVLGENESLKWFGGFSFDGKETWPGFGAGKFLIPRVLLNRGHLNIAVMDADDVELARHELEGLEGAHADMAFDLPAPTEKTYLPNYDSWQSWVDEALSLIRAEALEKLVLSRKATLRFEDQISPVALTARLHETTHACFVFCLDFGQGAFIGATPERLFSRRDDQLSSEVIAGTRRRGADETEDERLAIELLTSDKDQREHDIVRKSIRQNLHSLTEHLGVDSRASILRLSTKQHLRSMVKGVIKDGVDDGMLLQRLHPTPAVGGYPTENALAEIARIEAFNRGWYAAPVGWIDAKTTDFAVAIRSGLVEGNTLSLYSGAGIVNGSDPDEEWHEVENKITDFMSLLGH